MYILLCLLYRYTRNKISNFYKCHNKLSQFHSIIIILMREFKVQYIMLEYDAFVAKKISEKYKII